MNVVRARRSFRGLGQDITDSPIFQDIQTPQTTVDDFPMYNDPGLTEAENVSAVQAAQGATSLVPSIASSIPSAISNLTKGLAPGPSPRIAVPVTGSLFNPLTGMSSSTLLLLAAGAAALLLLSSPSGRRR